MKVFSPQEVIYEIDKFHWRGFETLEKVKVMFPRAPHLTFWVLPLWDRDEEKPVTILLKMMTRILN